MSSVVTPETIRLLGGSLCVDFANSVDYSDTDEPFEPEKTDVLRTPEMLARWGHRTGVIESALPGIDEVERVAATHLRTAVRGVLCAIARAEDPQLSQLDALADEYAEAVQQARLVRDHNAWRVGWPISDARRIRYAVSVDVVTLLSDERRLARLRRCPGRHCGWLFLDTSGRRRWCSMETCGSRAKMRRLYHRQRGNT